MDGEQQRRVNELELAARWMWRNEVILFAVQRISSYHLETEMLASSASLRRSRMFVRPSPVGQCATPPSILYQGLIESSGFFDADLYLAENPDVKGSWVNPVDHFVKHGGIEGRRPGRGFESALYLHAYPDVKEASVNPLVHYIQYGLLEGRQVGVSWPLPVPIRLGTQVRGDARFVDAIGLVTSFGGPSAYSAFLELVPGIQDSFKRSAELEEVKRQLYLATSALQRSVSQNNTLLRERAQLDDSWLARLARLFEKLWA